MTTIITCSGLAVAGALLVAMRHRRLDSMTGTRLYVSLLVLLAVVERVMRG